MFQEQEKPSTSKKIIPTKNLGARPKTKVNPQNANLASNQQKSPTPPLPPKNKNMINSDQTQRERQYIEEVLEAHHKSLINRQNASRYEKPKPETKREESPQRLSKIKSLKEQIFKTRYKSVRLDKKPQTKQ